MTFPVLILFAVGLVVFFIIGNQVMQCEAVVGSNEVNAGRRSSVVAGIEVRAPGKARSKLTEHTDGATPVVANTVAVFPVPFRPAGWKISNLITALAYVPQFSDEFYLRDHRILVDDIEKRAELMH